LPLSAKGPKDIIFPGTVILAKAEALARILKNQKLTIATAESLTSGLIAASLTSVPGSSAYFLAGINAYSNDSKESFLKVSSEILSTRGAVSEECSRIMARNIQSLVGADLGVSSTGIAGPDGATPNKPVGLVYLTVVSQKKIVTERHEYKGGAMR
jgi:PncC family amidohydrolase